MVDKEENFAKLMTDEERRIGLRKSTFANATGLFAPNHLMRKLLSLLPGGVKGIFEEVVDAHKLSTLLGTLQREPKFPAEYLEAQQLGKLKESFFVIKRKQGNAIRRSEDGKKKRQIKPDGSGNAHAQGCVVAEYYFTERRRP
jgi:hypothetical protein